MTRRNCWKNLAKKVFILIFQSFCNINLVGDVYGSVIGDNDANISTLQMLTSIENTLGTLLDMQETLPEDVIAEFEKKLEKDRRARLREEKIREQEALQKERVKRALERAQGDLCTAFFHWRDHSFKPRHGRKLDANLSRVRSRHGWKKRNERTRSGF